MAKRATASKTMKRPDAGTRILVVHGPEMALQRQAIDALVIALTTEHGEIERFQLDGKQAQLADVLDELRGYSLMQMYKLVIVDDAETFVSTHRQALERYAANPVDHATLVLRAGKWNKGNLDKAIEKVGLVIKCEALSHGKAEDWIIARAGSHHDCTIKPPASGLLVERVGADLARLDTELARLAVMVGRGGEIKVDLIESTVGHGSDAQAWVVQEAVLKALAKQDAGIAVHTVRQLIDHAGQAEVLVTYFVADLTRKLNRAVLMKRAGRSDQDISKSLRLWGPQQRVFFDALRALAKSGDGSGKLWRLLDNILNADRRSKSGLGTATRNLEGFCATLADTK